MEKRELRKGYTTGTCAAAAAKAAAWMLLTGKRLEKVRLLTPGGAEFELPVEETEILPNAVRCAIQKDSGDDPDVTNGIRIFAEVSRVPGSEITVDGGTGIGRVTKPGLDQPIGAAAINSVPRKMIRDAAAEIRDLLDVRDGLSVIISAPEGAELALKTFNPRLGIVGGISILGTSGIVEPMSDSAMIETIRLELTQKQLAGKKFVLLTPGNYGMNFIRKQYGITPDSPVMTSNFIGDALDICRDLEFEGILLIGHIGKLAKIAGGMMNTHSRYGDCRMEILASYGASCGLSAERVREILDCAVCDDAIRILREASLCDETMNILLGRVERNLSHRLEEKCSVGAVIFSNVYGILCQSEQAGYLITRSQED